MAMDGNSSYIYEDRTTVSFKVYSTLLCCIISFQLNNMFNTDWGMESYGKLEHDIEKVLQFVYILWVRVCIETKTYVIIGEC